VDLIDINDGWARAVLFTITEKCYLTPSTGHGAQVYSFW